MHLVAIVARAISAVHAEPQAAKKAATKLYARFRSHGVDTGCFCFGIREQTRNAPRVMRLYVARRVKLARPVEWPKTRRGGGGVGDTGQPAREINVRDTETRIKAVLDADEVASVLVENPSINIRIEGHTDSKGSDSYNLKLSRARAASVLDYLEGQGVDRSRMESVGFGEERPIEDNATETGRAANRRVEIHITSK